VEAVERHAELLDELEGGRQLLLGGAHRIRARRQPGAVEGADPEHVRAWPVERMPEADRDAEVVLHPLAEDDAVRLVDLEGERVA
jgi:hypothetical protein